MADVNGVNGSNPLAALQGAGRSIRITPTPPNATQTGRTTPTDAISFSKAAERLRSAQPVQAAPATYGVNGLQATTTAAAKQAIGQMVAARVETPMHYVSGQTPTRGGALPFYTNPSLANSAATSTSAARLGVGLDTSG